MEIDASKNEKDRELRVLQDENRLLKMILDAVPHSIYAKNLEGFYLVANQAKAEFHGMKKEEIITRTLEEFGGGLTPSEIQKSNADDERVFRSGKPLTEPADELTDFKGNKIFRNIHKLPLTDTEGKCIGLVGIDEDITERVQAEQALEKERNLLNTVFDVIPHSIFVKDRNLRYVKGNRVFLEFHGLREEKDILGKTIDDLKGNSPSEKAEIMRMDNQVVETIQPHHQYELEVTDHQGQKYVRNSYKIPFTDAQGRCVGLVSINEDITERVQAQRRVRMLERTEAIGQVVGGVCHNINNINQIISGNLHLLADDLTEDNSDIFRQIHSAIDRASTLLDQLLIYTQQRLVQDLAVIALNDLIESFLEKPGMDIPANIRLESESQQGLWPIVADRDGFLKALHALLENACQAMPEGGVVRIKTRNQGFSLQTECPDPEMVPGDYVILTVTDAGHGMSPDVAQKAFEPFFTTGNLASRSGLGLTRVYGMVMHAGGHILIESNEGRGTTVQMFLPKSKD